MIRSTNAYLTGKSWVKVQYLPQTAAPAAPTVYYSISGTVTDSGTGYQSSIAFSGLDTLLTDTSGSYAQYVAAGYTGVATPSAVVGTFAPASRSYFGVAADFTSQDYAHGTASPPLPTPAYLIAGTVTDAGTGFSAAIEFTGSGTLMSAASGSYGLLVGSGYSGTALPHLADGEFTPAYRVYSFVGSDQLNEDYDFNHYPVATPQSITMDQDTVRSIALTGTDYENVGLVCSALTLPTHGQLSHGGAYAPDPGYSGTDSFLFTCTDLGANPLTSAPAQISITITPVIPTFLISGTVTDSGTGFSAAVEFSGSGTVIAAASGSYGILVGSGYTGSSIPHYVGGDFTPASYVYVSVGSNMPNQDYAFTAYSPSGECPVPGANQIIALTPSVQLTRNVVDPVNKLLWILDDQSEGVRYVDLIGGTYAGSVTVPSPSQPGCAAIVYDSTTQKLVVTTYEGSVAFINPATKAVTFSNVFSFDNFDFHTLAAANGTAYMCPARTTNGRLWQVDCATELVTNSWSLLPDTVLSDSIAWADNIGKLVLMQSDFANWFWVFDPVTGVFTPSGQQSTDSFNYENYYVKATGHMLMSRQGSSRVEVVDIALGASGSTIGILDFNGGPNRIDDATEDTCSGRLFVGAGQYVYEFSLDGSYTPIFFHDADGDFGNLNNSGLSHSRATNFVYYENYNTNTVHTLKAVTTSGSVAGLAWSMDPTIDVPNAGGTIWYAGGDGYFNGSAVGSQGVFGKQFQSDNTASFINVDAPYPVQMITVYSGSMLDTGVIQQHSSLNLFQSFAGNTDSFSANTDGTFSGTLICTGTAIGYVAAQVSFTALAGGNLIAAPCNTFASINGATTITPIVPP